jgi:hypothetical protein
MTLFSLKLNIKFVFATINFSFILTYDLDPDRMDPLSFSKLDQNPDLRQVNADPTHWLSHFVKFIK